MTQREIVFIAQSNAPANRLTERLMADGVSYDRIPKPANIIIRAVGEVGESYFTDLIASIEGLSIEGP